MRSNCNTCKDAIVLKQTNPEAASISAAWELLADLLLCVELLLDLPAERLLVAQHTVVLLVLPERVLDPGFVRLHSTTASHQHVAVLHGNCLQIFS